MKEYLILIIQIGIFGIIFRFLGKFILEVFSFKIGLPYFKSFLNQIVGASTFVVINAIYYTGGKTVMMAFVIILLFIVFQEKKRLFNLSTINISNYFCNNGGILRLLILLLLTSALKIYFYNLNGVDARIPHIDYGFYAKVTSYLKEFGIENVSLEYINPERFEVQPYHYFELWLNLGFSNFIEGSYLYNYVMITSTYGLWVLSIGFLAVIETFKKEIGFTETVLAFTSTFFVGFNPAIFGKIKFMEVVDVFTVNPWFYQKLFPIYWFLVAAILCWHYKLRNFSIYILLIIPIVFISTAPSIFLALVIYIIYIKLYKTEKINEILNISMITFIVLLYMVIFYLNGKLGEGALDPKSSLIQISEYSHIRTAINIIGGTTIQLAILFIPYLLISVVNFNQIYKNKKIINNLMLPFLITGLSLITWSVLNNTPNSVQVFSNISIPILNILIFIAFIYTIYRANKSRIKTISVVIFILLLVHSIYQTKERIFNEQTAINTKFINQNILSKIENKIGIYLSTNNGLNVVVPTFHTPALTYHLLYAKNDLDVISLSTFEIPVNSKNRYFRTSQKIINSSTFNHYVDNQKNNNLFKSIKQSQIDFIDQYDIKFGIIASGSIVSDLIEKRIVERYHETITGDTLVLFK
jgi:hypothetical protein